MKKARGFKAILASLLVTTALAAPAVVLSSTAVTHEAELYFSGVSLEMLPDGSVQAIFEVSVDKVLNSVGASFILDYNPEYFTPSYIAPTQVGDVVHKKNERFTLTSDPTDDGFFAYDKTLYKPNESPFQREVTNRVWDDEAMDMVDKTSKYSIVVLGNNRISMNLLIDHEKIIRDQQPGSGMVNPSQLKPVGKLAPLRSGGFGGSPGDISEARYVINKYDTRDLVDNVETPERVTLGQLSFWVDPERLDEIARYFPQPFTTTTKAEVPMESGEETYLIRTTSPSAEEGDLDRDDWIIEAFQRRGGSSDFWTNTKYRAHPETVEEQGKAERYYELAVNPKQIMKVRPAEKEVTINAYQAYTDATWDDVAQALRRYSPMATVTYVDGTQDNRVIEWGKEGDDAGYTIEVRQADGSFKTVDLTDPKNPDPKYNPLEGVYRITQYVPGKSIHPIPITVTLTVTPIHLLDVQVANQTITYDLDNVVGQVEGPGDLQLAEKAQLITDIVPSGVSMVMDIPGWKPDKGTWPVATGSNESILMNSIHEDSCADGASTPYWPDQNDAADILADNYSKFLKQKNGDWIGEYTFHMAENFEPNSALKPVFAREEIWAKFPWLTVEEDEYPVPDSLRRIVTSDKKPNVTYAASYVSTVVDANGQPELTLNVEKTSGGTALAYGSIFRVWLPNGQELGTGLKATVWPDATEKEYTKNWFEDETTHTKNGDYHETAQGGTANRTYDLVINPGDPETGVFRTQRDTLRRHINLGGWYYVAVCEDPVKTTWSDPIPVFVPARPNEYQEDKVYNFVGENTELFNWPGDLTHYVTMPRGSYTAVDAQGRRLYDADGQPVTLADMLKDPTTYGKYLDDKGRPAATTSRYEEFYGYHTTYDGSTGDQPGVLYSFRVGPVGTPQGELWTPPVAEGVTADEAIPAKSPIMRYGPEDFYDGAVYAAYVANYYQGRTSGVVTQPAGLKYQVTIRRGEVTPKTKSQGITLTSKEATGITREDPNDIDSNVILATYDSRTEKYTDRQPYTFKITNIGTEPIYGLAIDGLTDGAYSEDPEGGRFVLLQAPADFLAPGQSTTFVMTYVYNLPANGAPNPDRYIDKLYITSSDHPKGGTDEDADYLLDFDAQFVVSKDKTHTVTVVVKPGDLSMGDAGLIVGGESGSMNYTPAARTYAAGRQVYVAVYMKDEYELVQVPRAIDATGNPLTVNPENNKNGYEDPDHPGIRVFWFTMPDYDTTVTVEFEEPILSKLRITDLIDFSAGTREELKQNRNPNDTVAEKNTYRVWRKEYNDEQELLDAENWHNTTSQNPEADLYLATVGTARPHAPGYPAGGWPDQASTPADEGQQFLSSENQYIVVIPHDADFSQVQVTLRKLATHNDYLGDGKNEDIMPSVTMLRYKSGFAKKWADTGTAPAEDPVYPTTQGYTAFDPNGTPPDYTPSVHVSDSFESPTQGTSDYVRITVSLGAAVRHYYLEIHRAPEEPQAELNYGNSPYGMIMNDVQFSSEHAQEMAKEAFRNNGYTFNGLAPMNVPNVVRRVTNPAVSQTAVYWREAWVYNTKLFEPESETGFVRVSPAPSSTAAPTPTPSPEPSGPVRQEPNFAPDPSVYPKDDEKNKEPERFEKNLDLSDYAFFAILGENMKEPGLAKAWDSTGRPVKLETVRVRATVTLLDTEASTQIGRFSGTKTAALDFGKAGKTLNGLPEPGVLGSAKEGTWPVSSETDPATGEVTYTQVEHIRPGQYTMEYVYSDYNGETLIVTRPLVILSSVGDVDSDGAKIGQTDEAVLKNRVADPLGYAAGQWKKNADGDWVETVYPRSNIFKYRVVDVNNDRNVNNIDGNLIDKIARGKATPLRFYNPVDYVYTGS